MPGKHKSPLYKGIGKYAKKAKGQRGFKMTSPLRNEFVQSQAKGSSIAGAQDEHARLRKGAKTKSLTSKQRARLNELNKLTEKAYWDKKSTMRKSSPAKGGWWAKQTKGHGGPS